MRDIPGGRHLVAVNFERNGYGSTTKRNGLSVKYRVAQKLVHQYSVSLPQFSICYFKLLDDIDMSDCCHAAKS